MGFCLFNSAAVAAAHAIEHGKLDRVAIIDFDVHHGNGTQAIFEHDTRVLYLSSHQSPLYPDTGYIEERGDGNVFNAPLPPGSGSDRFRAAWRERLLPALADFRPQLVIISAGFDGHWRDPLAQLQLQGGRLRLAHRRTGDDRRPPRGRPDALDARRRIRPAGARRMQRRARGGAVGVAAGRSERGLTPADLGNGGGNPAPPN
jgi:hypothetical protein